VEDRPSAARILLDIGEPAEPRLIAPATPPTLGVGGPWLRNGVPRSGIPSPAGHAPTSRCWRPRARDNSAPSRWAISGGRPTGSGPTRRQRCQECSTTGSPGRPSGIWAPANRCWRADSSGV